MVLILHLLSPPPQIKAGFYLSIALYIITISPKNIYIFTNNWKKNKKNTTLHCNTAYKSRLWWS